MAYLLQLGLDINAADVHGMTAAIYAASLGHPDCLRVLKEAGADLNLQNKKGQTAWWHALQENHDECLELLQGASRGPHDSCCDKVVRRIAALPSSLAKK
jgi:ankyrin repeat protein